MENSLIWRDVLEKTFFYNGVSDYVRNVEQMQETAFPILKEWDNVLGYSYPLMVQHRVNSHTMATASLCDMNDAELYFTCGLLSYETYKHCATLSSKMAEDKYHMLCKGRNPRECRQMMKQTSSLDFYPTITELFRIILDRDEDKYQIPLCKSYLGYVQNIRNAAGLVRDAAMPDRRKPLKRQFSADSLSVPGDLNQTRYQILRELITARNSLYFEKNPIVNNDLNLLLSSLSKQHYINQVQVLKTIPFNNRDPHLSDRTKVACQIMQDVMVEPFSLVQKDFDKHVASCCQWMYQMIGNNHNALDAQNYENALNFRKAVKDFVAPLFKKTPPVNPMSYKNQKQRD